jgi:RNA 2',3'-cyclic 3'-phosphodiesterase
MDVRCFIAVNLPDETKKTLENVISELKKTEADVRWVNAGNIHLTLKFLGNTAVSQIPAMTDALSKKLSHYNAFYITIADIGCFPSEKRPRVIWVGIKDSDVLTNIKKDVDAVLTGFAFAPEVRFFSPHLTIGRVRSMKKVAELMKHFADFKRSDFGRVEVSAIHIMKSELKPAGAEYCSLGRIPLENREE